MADEIQTINAVRDIANRLVQEMFYDKVNIGILEVRIVNVMTKEGTTDDQTFTTYSAELLERADGTWVVEDITKERT